MRDNNKRRSKKGCRENREGEGEEEDLVGEEEGLGARWSFSSKGKRL